MRFELFIAARYLRAKRRQAVVGVITVISVIGVAVGVASLIIALAITNGMYRDLQERLLSSTAHIDLLRVQSDGIRDWRNLTARLARLPHVTAAAPGLYEQVLVARGAQSNGAILKGILPNQERTVSDLLAHITQGTAAPLMEPESAPQGMSSRPKRSEVEGPAVHPSTTTNPSEDQRDEQSEADRLDGQSPPIVLGSDLAEILGAKPGDSILTISPQGEMTPVGIIPKYQRFRLTGIFHSGFYQYDSSWGFLRLSDAQRLFGEPDVISVISFKVDNLYHADTIARSIEQAAGPGFMTTNWMQQNRELFRALRLEQIFTVIVIGLIVCVAALNILIALTMMVMEKSRDIAVLMSYGVQASQVRRIFQLQGLLICVLGTACGLILGYGLAFAGAHYRIHLSSDVYSIDYLPFAPRIRDGVIVSLVSLTVSLLATLYPSSSAARILPAEALRYE